MTTANEPPITYDPIGTMVYNLAVELGSVDDQLAAALETIKLRDAEIADLKMQLALSATRPDAGPLDTAREGE